MLCFPVVYSSTPTTRLTPCVLVLVSSSWAGLGAGAGAGAGAGEEAMLYFLGLMVISWLASTAELMLMDTNSRSVSVTSWTLYWDSYIITLLSL